MFTRLLSLNPTPGIPHPEYMIRSGVNSSYYYIPGWVIGCEEGTTVNNKRIKKFLNSYGFTDQVYYDVCILGLTSPEDRPKCKNPKCGHFSIYKKLSKGYTDYCCQSCNASVTSVGRKCGCSDEKRRKLSLAGIKRFQDHPDDLIKFINSPGKNPYKKGYYTRNGVRIRYDSSYELKFLELMPSDISISRGPIINYMKSSDGLIHKYYVDFDFTLESHRYLIEIKPYRKLVDQDVIDKKLAAIKYSESLSNCTYLILTEKELFSDEDILNFIK